MKVVGVIRLEEVRGVRINIYSSGSKRMAIMRIVREPLKIHSNIKETCKSQTQDNKTSTPSPQPHQTSTSTRPTTPTSTNHPKQPHTKYPKKQ